MVVPHHSSPLSSLSDGKDDVTEPLGRKPDAQHQRAFSNKTGAHQCSGSDQNQRQNIMTPSSCDGSYHAMTMLNKPKARICHGKQHVV